MTAPGGPGKISWFGGQQTANLSNANTTPGIAVYDQATLNGYWLVHMPNGETAVVKQIDIGPAPWTGRKYDFSVALLAPLGYTQGNFPTNASITATYLGKTVPPQYQSLVIGAGGHPTTNSTPAGGGSSTGTTTSGSDWSHLLLDIALFGLGTALLFKGGKRTLDPVTS